MSINFFKNKVTLLSLCLSLNVSAALLPYPSTLPKVKTNYDEILKQTWEGIKKRNVDPYQIKMIHRPYSEAPGDMVSEGIGYGMILALYCNDQTYFNLIWDAGEENLWSEEGNCYDWRLHLEGKKEPGAATDAEQDIALCLIFADQLVKKNIWTEHQSPKGVTYAQRANTLINNIWNTMVQDGLYLKPGDSWGGKDLLNPGYFSPAFYRVYDEFEETDHNWKGLIDGCYSIIAKSEGYEKGLIPDFMNSEGVAKAAGYNTYAESKHLYKDAIRIYWRIATDYLWYQEQRAKQFLQNAITFIQTPQRANFYQMSGDVVPETDSFALGNNVTRPRAEHSHLTIGMWACAAIAVGDTLITEAFSDELLKYYEPGKDYWGRSSDENLEDTLHNEMYFDQFLAWFGASMLSGVFTNVWEDMKDPDPLTPLAWTKEPVFSTRDINASVAPFTIKALFNKYARWTITLSHVDSASQRLFSGTGETLAVSWNGLSSDGYPMVQGWYNITITARGLSKPFTHKVWLGKSFDLMENGRLIVDDFRDADLNPFIGNIWQSYLDSHEGKAGKSSVKNFSVKTIDGKQCLNWSYLLDQGNLGFDPYAALEWNCTMPETGNLDLTGIDTIIITAKSAQPLSVSVQLIISGISDYNFHHDSLNLTTSFTEYKFPINQFKQRFGGDAPIDLTKLTAIRFQVQGPNGDENSIILSKISFTGDISKIYIAPPEYKPIATKRVTNAKSPQFDVFYSISKKGISFSIPSSIRLNQISIVDITGKVISRLKTNRTDVFLPLPNRTSKIAFARFHFNGNIKTIPIALIQ